MTEQDLFAVKPGNTRPKITNSDFKKNQIKIHKLGGFKYSQVDSQVEFCKNKQQQQTKELYLCKYRNRTRVVMVTGFNFKKCSAAKFLYGTGMYKYKYSGDYNHQLVETRNIQKKCRQKLRNELCLKWE